MIPKILASLCVLAFLLSPGRAQNLLFTTNYVATGLVNSKAVVHDGTNAWVVVGDGTNVVRVQFTGSGYSVTSYPLNTNASLSSVIFVGNNTYIAGGRPRAADGSLGNAPLIVVSTNGGTGWSIASTPNFGVVPIQGLAFDSGSNRLVAVGALRQIAYANGVGPAFTWVNASLDEPSSFFESYSSVISLGSGSFVVAGIAEGIRYSLNGGVNWANGNPLVSLDKNNMNAVVLSPDGTNVIVVGQQGRVLVSTNRGVNWNTGISSPTLNNLNSIVTLGSHLPADGNFLAAGDTGIVLRSTNGLTWTTTNVTSVGLRGGFFAASTGSQLVGTGVLIGDNATVVLAGTTPAPANTTNASGCDGSGPFVLSAATSVDPNLHPANTTVIDWYAADGTTLLQTNANTFSTNAVSTNPNGPTLFTFQARARDLRTGLTSQGQAAVLTVNPRPKSVVSLTGAALLCNGSSTTIQAVLTGIGPWTVQWSDGSNQVVNVSPAVRAVTPVNPLNTPLTNTYTVTNLTDANCVANAGDRTGSATVVINPTPKVTAVTNQTQAVCNGTATAVVSFAGTATSFTWVNNTPAIGLAASGTNAIASFVATNSGASPLTATITVTPHYANGGLDCLGATTNLTITVNPTPTMTAVTNQTQTVCNGSTTAAVSFGGTATSFTWANNTPTIGLAASGAGAIASFVATNSGSAPLTATITVTPHYVNGGVDCLGATTNVTITVNPEPIVTAVTNQAQAVCNGTVTAAVSFGGTATSFTWTNNTPAIGLAASGTNAIASFVATNSGSAPLTATITVTPHYLNNGLNCTGVATNVTITVNPTPTVTAVTNQTQTVCNGTPTLGVNFAGTATSFTWVKNNTNVLLGAVNGTGDITPFVATNSGGTPVTATITVTPHYVNGGVDCLGATTNVSITVNPQPTVAAVTNQAQTVCNGSATAAVSFGGTATSFTWVNNTPAIGLAASGAGNIASFAATNSGNNALTATITVTPHYLNNGADCTGNATNVSITVNPTPTVTSVANQAQTVCSGSVTTPVTFIGNGASYFMWVKNGTNLLGPASGTGTINSFGVINNGNLPVSATITVTPVYTNSLTGGPACFGVSTNVNITVNPTPTVTNVVNQTQTVNLGNMTAQIDVVGTFTAMAWTNNNPNLGGLAASGGAAGLTGMFQLMTFTPTNPGTMTITFTPYYTNSVTGGPNCPGASADVTINVIDPAAPTFTIQSLNSSNVVLRWVATTNTTLLSATNLTPTVNWSSNATFGAGTNLFTNSILTPPPYRFFRLTNAP